MPVSLHHWSSPPPPSPALYLPHVKLKCKTFASFEVNTGFYNFIRTHTAGLHCVRVRKTRVCCAFRRCTRLLMFTRTASPLNMFFKMAPGQVVKSKAENAFLISVKLMQNPVYQMYKLTKEIYNIRVRPAIGNQHYYTAKDKKEKQKQWSVRKQEGWTQRQQ